MMRIAAILILLLLSAPALAGTLTFQFTNATDGTVSKVYNTFSDAEMTRWIAANQTACNVDKNGTCTRVQVLNFIITKFIKDQVALVKSHEQNAAATSASSAITPINPQ